MVAAEAREGFFDLKHSPVLCNTLGVEGGGGVGKRQKYEEFSNFVGSKDKTEQEK